MIQHGDRMRVDMIEIVENDTLVEIGAVPIILRAANRRS